jgi:signal transduction histidine kinase
VSEIDSDHDFDEPLLSWVMQPGGGCQPVGTAPALPRRLCAATPPITADVAGNSFRLLGRRIGGGGLVVGASLVPTGQQLGEIILAELVVGPLLLALVFVGAFAVGSRVGGPVERMRQRQLAFTADASHELRTPLTVMQAETSLALSGNDRELRPAVQRVSGEIGRMRHIVEDLLWLARFDSEPQPPQAQLIDLGTAARTAEERFGTVAAGRSLALTVEAPAHTLLVSMPVEWLDRRIGVLVDNACRHAHSKVWVEARAAEGGRAELSVSDDGDGIPDAELSLVFDRFHRATSAGQGAGLGLAIADSVVRATHGRWQVANLAGGGARFAVVWPVAREAHAGSGESTTSAATPPSTAGGRVEGALPSAAPAGRSGSPPLGTLSSVRTGSTPTRVGDRRFARITAARCARCCGEPSQADGDPRLPSGRQTRSPSHDPQEGADTGGTGRAASICARSSLSWLTSWPTVPRKCAMARSRRKSKAPESWAP